MAIDAPRRRCRRRPGPDSPWAAGDRLRALADRPVDVAVRAADPAPSRRADGGRLRAMAAVGVGMVAVVSATTIGGVTSALLRVVGTCLPLHLS